MSARRGTAISEEELTGLLKAQMSWGKQRQIVRAVLAAFDNQPGTPTPEVKKLCNALQDYEDHMRAADIRWVQTNGMFGRTG